MGMISGVFPENGSRRYCLMLLLLLFQPALMATGDRVIASAHNGLNAYLLSCNIVKYLRPLAIGGKGLLADTTAYLDDYQWGVPTASMPLKNIITKWFDFKKTLISLKSNANIMRYNLPPRNT